jgi:hypothetical protein
MQGCPWTVVRLLACVILFAVTALAEQHAPLTNHVPEAVVRGQAVRVARGQALRG